MNTGSYGRSAPSVDLLVKLSKALCCDMEDLIRSNSDMKEEQAGKRPG